MATTKAATKSASANRGSASMDPQRQREIEASAPLLRTATLPSPRINGLDQASRSAVRSLHIMARTGTSIEEVESVNALRLHPHVGQYKAEVLEWLRGGAQ